MKNKLIVLMMILVLVLSISGCSIGDIVEENKDGLSDIVNDAEEAINQITDSDEDDANPTSTPVPTETEQEIKNEGSIESIADYLKEVYSMKEYFTAGHKDIGYIYKNTHDNINDFWDYVNGLKVVCASHDYTDTWSYEDQLGIFGQDKFNHNLSLTDSIYTYSKVGTAYKNKSLETELYSYDMENTYDEQNGIYTYSQLINYVDNTFRTKAATYYIDDNGALYISYLSLDLKEDQIDLILAYYDGAIVKIGHTTGLSSDTSIVPVDLNEDLPTSMEDFFQDIEFDITFTYDGSNTTHSVKE